MSHYLADLVAPLDALLLKGDADPSTRAIMNAALVLTARRTTTRWVRHSSGPREQCRACGNEWSTVAGRGGVRRGFPTMPST